MITEDYCSYEVAKLLKEKGFNESCEQIYDGEGDLLANNCRYINEESPNEYFHSLAPTHQMAIKWLREVYNTNISIVPIWNQKRFEYQVFVVTPENAKHCYIDDKLYLSYEEAVEAALEYSLKNLI